MRRDHAPHRSAAASLNLYSSAGAASAALATSPFWDTVDHGEGPEPAWGGYEMWWADELGP